MSIFASLHSVVSNQSPKLNFLNISCHIFLVLVYIFVQLLNPNIIVQVHKIHEYYKFNIYKPNYSSSNTRKGSDETKSMIKAQLWSDMELLSSSSSSSDEESSKIDSLNLSSTLEMTRFSSIAKTKDEMK